MQHNKIFRMFFVLIVCLFCAGCVSQEKKVSVKDTATELPENAPDETVSSTGTALPAKTETPKKEKETSLPGFMEKTVKNNITLFMETVDKDVVLILLQEKKGVKGYFIDTASRKRISVIEGIDYSIKGYRICSYQENIVLQSSFGQCFVFDRDYQLVSQFDVSDLHNMEGMDSVCILPDSRQILFCKDKLGDDFSWLIYSTGYQKKKKHKVLKLPQGEASLNYISSFSEMSASEDEHGLFFLGKYFTNLAEQSRSCYGYYDMEKDAMYVYYDKITEKIGEKNMLLTGDMAYFYDGAILDKYYTGKVYCVDQNGKRTVWQLEDKRESGYMVLSDDKNYIATYYRETVKEDEYRTVIKIYDRKTYKHVSEVTVNEYLQYVLVFGDGTVLGAVENYDGKKMETEFIQRDWRK